MENSVHIRPPLRTPPKHPYFYLCVITVSSATIWQQGWLVQAHKLEYRWVEYLENIICVTRKKRVSVICCFSLRYFYQVHQYQHRSSKGSLDLTEADSRGTQNSEIAQNSDTVCSNAGCLITTWDTHAVNFTARSSHSISVL